MSHTRRPEALPTCGPVESWDVDADAQPAILAWMGSSVGWAAIAAHGSCFLKLLSGLVNELLNIGISMPCAFLRETCREACLQVVPERLRRDLGKVGGSLRLSPRALPEEGANRAFLCDGRRFPLGRHGP